MKEFVRVIIITILATLYCFEISNIYNVSLSKTSSLEEKESSFTSITQNLLLDVSKSENSINIISNPSFSGFKVLFNSYLINIKTAQQFFAKEFSQYTFSTINFLVSFCKPDIIYPFHYYW